MNNKVFIYIYLVFVYIFKLFDITKLESCKFNIYLNSLLIL